MIEQSIQGSCPMGCGATLHRLAGGAIACHADDCPRPTAAAELLAEHETEHIVHFTQTGWSVQHPLRERLDLALLTCPVGATLAQLHGPPDEGLGVYRATINGDQLTLDRLEDAST